MASVKYDPVPFATTATADSLQQHESIMSAFARHRDALRRRAADTTESPPSRTLGDAVLIVIDVFAIAYAPKPVWKSNFRRPTPSTRCCPRRPKHVSGSECALIGLLENILAPLWVFARFGDVPSAWTVAGGALLLATLIGHEVAAREPVRVSQPGARGYRTVNNL